MATAAQSNPNVLRGYDAHDDNSRAAQLRADKWMIAGTLLMGTAILGFIGFPLFLRGLMLQREAQRAGFRYARSSSP